MAWVVGEGGGTNPTSNRPEGIAQGSSLQASEDTPPFGTTTWGRGGAESRLSPEEGAALTAAAQAVIDQLNGP